MYLFSQAIGITSATCLGILLVLEIINVISGLHPIYPYYTKYNLEEKKLYELMGIMFLLTVYIIIFWIWPSHVLLTGLRTGCSKKLKPWILSMLFQSLILFVFFFWPPNWLLQKIQTLDSIPAIKALYIFGSLVLMAGSGWFFWWLALILIVLLPQIFVWTVARDTYR